MIFPRPWYEGIIFKLRQYGISDQIINWVENYLLNRKQKVVLDGYTSALGSASSGVPQGSVLGPFLFLLIINDISCDITNNVRLFADDISLYIVVDQDIVGAANPHTNDLGKLDRWSIQWIVDFNPKKTINLNFTRKNINHPIIKFGGNDPKFKMLIFFMTKCLIVINVDDITSISFNKYISNFKIGILLQ